MSDIFRFHETTVSLMESKKKDTSIQNRFIHFFPFSLICEIFRHRASARVFPRRIKYVANDITYRDPIYQEGGPSRSKQGSSRSLSF